VTRFGFIRSRGNTNEVARLLAAGAANACCL